MFTVAIDGPAAAGKGTIARALARHFGMGHLDTGLLYRATGRRMLDGTDPVTAAVGLTEDDLGRSDLRTAEVGQAASEVAAIAEVRQALLEFQRTFARREGGAVLDGRDIGTVICPDAEVKLFVTADANTRAHRRWLELRQSAPDVAEEDVVADLAARDARDAGRDSAPMRPAEDARLLDTSKLTIDEAIAIAIDAVEVARGG
jgi:cytidylate kinase